MKKSNVHLIFITLISVTTAVAYSNSFHGAFVFDDFINIINVKSIRLFQPDISGIINAATDAPNARRWLPNLSFAVNYYFGGEAVWGYHLINLIIHLCTASILYFLCYCTLSLPLFADKIIRKREIAFIAALLWAVHPVQTNGVTYIVQRMTSMCTLFYMTSILLYVQGRLKPVSRAKRNLYFCASLLFGLMAITSKENALMLPVMILGYELFFLQTIDWGKNYKKNSLIGIVGISSIFIIAYVFFGNNIFTSIFEGYNLRSFTLYERLLTESSVIHFYLTLLAFPLPSRLNLSHDFPISNGLLSPPETLLAVLGIIILTALIPLFFNKNRLFSFALFWFLGNLIIESSIVPLEIIFEHRLYLPSTFLLLSLTCTIYQISAPRPQLVRIFFISILSIFTLWTWQRNQVWANNKTLWSDVVAKSPGLARGYNNLGVALHEEGNLQESEKLFLKAIQIEPESRIAYISLGSLYVTQNRLQEAEKVLRNALTKETYLTPSRIYHYLGVMYRKSGDYLEAIKFANLALKLEENDLEPMITIGICYEKLEEYSKADAIFYKASTSGLNYNIDLYNNWGIVVKKMGQTDRSIKYFKKALELDPDHPESHYNLGLAYGEKGMINEARREMQLSMELRQKTFYPDVKR